MKHKITLLALFATASIASAATFLMPDKEPVPGAKAYLLEQALAEQLGAPEEPEKLELNGKEFALSSAYQSGNLQLFFIRGEEQAPNRQYLTLSEALEKKLVKVHETGSVQQLKIDNNSDQEVFILSGDIVKGGRQDRTVRFDVIIPPNTKNMALQSFCVESNRWQSRGNENAQEFESNTKLLSSRELKVAAKYEQNQGKVWSEVAKQQVKLNEKVEEAVGYEVDVRNNRSASSLQLALESKELEEAKKTMLAELGQLLAKEPDAVGFAYAINGEVYGADVYNNRQLLEDLWEKMLDAAVVEAVSQRDTSNTQAVATAEDVKELMEQQAEKARKVTVVNQKTELVTTEGKTKEVVHFTTNDKAAGNGWVHFNCIKMDSAAMAEQAAPSIEYQQEQLNVQPIDFNSYQRR